MINQIDAIYLQQSWCAFLLQNGNWSDPCLTEKHELEGLFYSIDLMLICNGVGREGFFD